MKSLHWYIVSFFFVLFSCLFYSCTHVETPVDNIKVVNVLNVDTPLKITMSDIVDSISYVPLSTERCLLSYIEKVQYDSCFYFIKDARGLYVFDKAGQFVNEIGRKGPGPKEYLYINAFYLDKVKKNVCIISYPDRKLLTYSYSGDFLSMSRLEKEDAYVSTVIPMMDGQLLVHRPLPNEVDRDDYEYVMLSSQEGGYKSYPLLEHLGVKSDNVHYSFLRYPMTFWNEEYYAISTFSNVVYRYTDLSLTPDFCLNMPDISPSKTYIESRADMDFFSLSKELDENKIGKGITAVASSDENLFMFVRDGQTVIFDGKEAIVVAPFVYQPDVDIYGYSLFSGGLFDDMIGHYEASSLLSKQEYINNGNNPILKRIVAKLHDEDNPVVFRCHLKKNLIERLKEMIQGKM